MSFLFSRSIPPTNTQATAYQWPSSPILPPISSRTPHLVPETFIPTTTQQLAITNSSSINSTHNHHHKSAGSWIETKAEPEISENQFDGFLQPRVSSSGSSNKYTRQRERASRSLDKYWSERQMQFSDHISLPTLFPPQKSLITNCRSFFSCKNLLNILMDNGISGLIELIGHASASTTRKKTKNTQKMKLESFSTNQDIDWQAKTKRTRRKILSCRISTFCFTFYVTLPKKEKYFEEPKINELFLIY